MARYATGKKSKAISDISGFKVDYTELKTTYDNLRVEPSEFDPKHPQLTPAKNVIDATALFQPRPDNDPENVSFFVGFNTDIFASKIQNAQKGIGVKGLATIGTFTIRVDHSQDVTGVNATGALGTLNFKSTITETGLAGTGAIGTSVITNKVNETGVSGTGAIGGFGVTDGASIKLSISETGLAGTGAIGTVATGSLAIESGVAGTGAIGSVSITIAELGWSGGDWGESTWGQ
jgi:hypothetical protein|tara:strand:+ start:4108 stop:4809 length:702 start_codon:yes stop_codon:yes gene_type:complete